MGMKNTPAFEADTNADTAVADAPTTKTTTTVEGPAMQTTAVAAPAQTAVSTSVNPGMLLAYSDKKNFMPLDTVEGLSLAAPRIKGEQGVLTFKDGELGTKIRMQLVSWNFRWTIGTGESDKEATDYFRVSYDDQTTTEGENVDDYLASLRAQGFDKARKSQYADIWGFVVWSEKDGDVPVEKRELAILQCSPTSRGAFMMFCTTQGMLGMANPNYAPSDIVEVHAERRAKGTDKFTNFSFHRPA